MTRRERPPAVARHRNTALWLPVAALALFGWFFVTEDLPASRPERVDRPDEVAVDGRVLRQTTGGALEVRYTHPVTEQEVTAEVYVWDGDLVGEPGRTISLVADRDDPLSASAAGDVMPWHTNAVVYLAWLAGTTLPALTRRYGMWRSERLARTLSPGFAMAGVVTPSPKRRFRCDLHLYPLDAPEHAPPVCTVAVLTTGGARLGAHVFAVEAKGFPRPLGRVVARTGETVLWPAGRASRRAVHPRPSGPVRPVTPLAAAERPSGTRRSGVLRAVGREIGVLAACMAALAVAVVVTSVNRADARAVVTEGRPVVGEVVDHEETDTVVVLRYEEAGATRVTRAPADFAGDYRKGTRYPVRLDPDDPARARLDAEPYDAVEPIAWLALPAIAAAGLVWSRLRSWRRNRTVAAEGPWWAARARAGDRDGEVVVTDHDDGVVCGVMVQPARSAVSAGEPVGVVVAGDAEPGAPVAVWRAGGRGLPVVLPATNAGSYGKTWTRWRRPGSERR